MYLLDTDVLSNLTRPTPSPRLVARLAALAPDLLFSSSITLGELLYGALRDTARTMDLRSRIERTLPPAWRIVPFDIPAARRYAEIRAELEGHGMPLAEPDLRIAAIALAKDFTLVTGNVRHFGRVPNLRVENWLQP